MHHVNEMDQEVIAAMPVPFEINSAERANWLVRKIIDARCYAKKVTEWAEQEHRRAASEERALLHLFGRQLESWAVQEIALKGGRRKSVCLPAGTVGFRETGAKLVIDDEAIVIEWAKQHAPEAVITSVRLSKSTLDALLHSTGVVPEVGAHVEPARNRFFVR
jgi:hypothetical protein